MPNYTQGYERNTRSPKFYSTAVGHEGYNPVITIYYGSDDKIVRVEEAWRDEIWGQTISGTTYAQQWPTYSYVETVYAWEEVTSSG